MKDHILTCPACGAAKKLSIHMDTRALVRIPIKKGRPNLLSSLIKAPSLTRGEIAVSGTTEETKLIMKNIQYIGPKKNMRISIVPDEETQVMLYCPHCEKMFLLDKDDVLECSDVELLSLSPEL